MILVVYSVIVCLFLLLYIKGNLIYKNKKIDDHPSYSARIKQNKQESTLKCKEFESIHEVGRDDKIQFIQQLSEEERKQHSLHQLYPMAHLFLSWMDEKKGISSFFHKYIWTEKIEKIYRGILIGENKERYEYLEKCKIISSSFLVIFLVNLCCILLFIVDMNNNQLHNGFELMRPNQGSNHLLLDAYIEEDGAYHKSQYEVIVEEKKHTKEEATTIYLKFCDEVEQLIIGDNSTMDMITKDLNFMNKLPNTKIPITWKTSHPSIINKKGKVLNDGLTVSQLVEIKVILDYIGCYMEHSFYVDVYPKEEEILSLEEDLEQEIHKSIEQTEMEEKVSLPNTVRDKNVYWEEVKGSKHSMVLVLGLIGVIIIITVYKKQLDTQYEKRNQQMIYDYSEVVSKLGLFLRAGISLYSAWERIVLDYKSSKEEKRYIYEEMILSLHDMNLGKDELMVLEDFGRRVTIPCYLRFVSLITQNIQKGNGSLLNLLEYEAKEAYMERRELIKRLGEEAGTKLLVPMMLHLIIVLLIIMIPAFLSFGL